MLGKKRTFNARFYADLTYATVIDAKIEVPIHNLQLQMIDYLTVPFKALT